MDTQADEVLINLVVSYNDQRAFTQLVNNHQSTVRATLRQLTNWNDALADDLAQETFIQAYKYLHQFNGQSKFSSWLYRIAYNQFLQYCRKKQNQHIHEPIDKQPIADASLSPLALQSGRQLQQQFAQVLNNFTPERRTVLHLMIDKQYTQQEIADIMNIPLGTVKTHISRGRLELRKRLSQWQVTEHE